jgi:hypothetical protein
MQGSATLEVPAAPAAAAGCQAALHFIHEETLGDCWDRRKRLCDDMYRGVHGLDPHSMPCAPPKCLLGVLCGP